MELGLEPGKIAKKYLLDRTISEMKFVGEVLSTIEIFNNDEILFTELQQDWLVGLKA